MKTHAIAIHRLLLALLLICACAAAARPVAASGPDGLPTYEWHTFYGAPSGSEAESVALDSSGNIYILGMSSAAWNGPDGQMPKGSNTYLPGAANQFFILKLSSDGQYLWHVFFGGADTSMTIKGITVDPDGNVYATSSSRSAWNVGGQTPKNPFFSLDASPSSNLFVIKFSRDGIYQWHTFFCGGHGDIYEGSYGRRLVTDSSGNIYVAGYGNVYWTGASGQQPKDPIVGSGHTATNAFALKLSSSGVWQWNAFFGAGDNQSVWCDWIAADENGNLYISGNSDAPFSGHNGAAPLHAFYPTPGGSTNDLYVVKLGMDGAYKWHTFWGTNQYNNLRGLAVDRSANVYVTAWVNTSG